MLRRMRTTVRLPDELLRRAKRHAAETGQTLTSLIERALRRELQRPRPDAPTERFRVHTVDGRGVLPGVDLDDTAALLDRMDRPDAAP